MSTLVLLVGFAVDLGSWYLAASRLQRASDAASLSAVGLLPDTTAAQAEVDKALEKNGVHIGGNITRTITTTASTIDVTVENSKVPTYFVSAIVPSMKISRTSQAQQQGMIPLGNPYNVFGFGTGAPGGTPINAPPQTFWAAINGTCSPAADGGLFESKWDGNLTMSGGVGVAHNCSPGAANANPYYRNGGFNGYSYEVDVPAGSPPVSIDAYDPQFACSPDHALDLCMDLSNNDGPNTAIATLTDFAVYKNSGTEDSTDPPIANHQFRDGESPGRLVWYTLYKEPSNVTGARHYKIQVFNTHEYQADIGYNMNAYALMASPNSNHVTCDTRTDPLTCPKLYGLGAVSVYNNVGNGQSTFYLADIDPASAGSQITAYMWDPGEGAQSIEIVSPNNTPVPFTWNTTPNNNMTTSAGSGMSINVGDPGGQPRTGINGSTVFNDRLITMTFTVPSNYSDYYTGNDHWWKIRYTSGASIKDRTTFGVLSSSGSPPRLTK